MTIDNMKTPPCVLVSKREREGSEGKKYYFIGIVSESKVTGELGVSEEIYRSISEELFYKPYVFSVTFNDSPKYGSYLTVNFFEAYQPQDRRVKAS